MVEVAQNSFNIINEYNLSLLLIEMRGNVANNFKETKEICSQYGVPLYKPIFEFEEKNFDPLGIIKGDELDDTVILFKDFFIFFSNEVYKAYYKDVKCVDNSTNKFIGDFKKINIKQEKLNEINFYLDEILAQKENNITNYKSNKKTVKKTAEDENWEPCPRCGSKKVKDISNTSNWKYLGGVLLSFIRPTLGAIAIVICFLNDIFAFFSSSVHLSCKDCEKTWKK